jgi:hypothetical protein
MKLKQFVHEYSGYNGVPSTCRLMFYRAETGILIAIADELPTNSGTPIREFSEHLATQAYRLMFAPNEAHVEAFIFIEHAPASRAAVEYSYTRVDFEWDEGGQQFIHPERIPMTDEEVRELVGEEL